jgi:hypothetical protein
MAIGRDTAAAVMAHTFSMVRVGEKIMMCRSVCPKLQKRTLCLNDDLFTTFRV